MLASMRFCFMLILAGIGPVSAQDRGTLDATPLAPLENSTSPAVPAKELFARKPTPFPGPARSIGFYSHGCLAGAAPLPINGPAWQVMRLSRNRNWGNPKLIAFLERFANNAKKVGWNGLLVGDMSQPRGGPMLSGHASHQVGLDADIWFTPMPNHVLSREEREFTSATQMVARKSARRRSQGVDARTYRARPDRSAGSRRRRASSSMRRSRKRCAARLGRIATGCPRCGRGGGTITISTSASPVRRAAPSASRSRRPGPGDGCGHELDFWFKESTLHPKPPLVPPKPKPPLTLAGLPPACRQVVDGAVAMRYGQGYIA